MDLQALEAVDRQLLMMLNGSESPLLDQMVLNFTNGLTWAALYITLFYVVIKNNETMSQIGLAIGGVVLALLLSGGIDDGIVKPLVARPRPCVDPLIEYSVNVVHGYRLPGYGFFSAHAANTMALAVFISLLLRSRLVTSAFLLWSLLNGLSRIYLGVHYPGDVLCGFVWGALAGIVAYLVYFRLYSRMSPKIKYISSQYTSAGYDYADIHMLMAVMVLTLCYVIIKAVICVV